MKGDKSFAVDIPSVFFGLNAMLMCILVGVAWQVDIVNLKVVSVFLLFLFICLFALRPHFFIADGNGLTAYYVFFLKDYYKWDDIIHIEEKVNYRYSCYSFEMKEHRKKAFFMSSEFHKNFMLKRLIKKYWQGDF